VCGVGPGERGFPSKENWRQIAVPFVRWKAKPHEAQECVKKTASLKTGREDKALTLTSKGVGGEVGPRSRGHRPHSAVGSLWSQRTSLSAHNEDYRAQKLLHVCLTVWFRQEFKVKVTPEGRLDGVFQVEKGWGHSSLKE
jgi:hypothetical protein